VIASGASMHEALTATKVLAEDCRLKGTAFRLGVCFYSNTLLGLAELAIQFLLTYQNLIFESNCG